MFKYHGFFAPFIITERVYDFGHPSLEHRFVALIVNVVIGYEFELFVPYTDVQSKSLLAGS